MFEKLFGDKGVPTQEAAEDAGLEKGRSEQEIDEVLADEGVSDMTDDQDDDTKMAA